MKMLKSDNFMQNEYKIHYELENTLNLIKID